MGDALRSPAVAGQFYRGDPESLRRQVEGYILPSSPRKCIGVVSPHAGLMYSGSVAGAVFSSVLIPETVLLIGPNHTGFGERASIMASGKWGIPTGTFPVNSELAGALMKMTPLISENSTAHLYEHSLEVQLPFIRYFRESTSIVPLTLMQLTYAECEVVGQGIAEAIRSCDEDVMIVASSDMSHYVSDETARKKDHMAIEKMIALDPGGLYDVIRKENITMCGYIPATIMLIASKMLGANVAELVRYATSAEVSGDYDHVVGYAGIVVRSE